MKLINNIKYATWTNREKLLFGIITSILLFILLYTGRNHDNGLIGDIVIGIGYIVAVLAIVIEARDLLILPNKELNKRVFIFRQKKNNLN